MTTAQTQASAYRIDEVRNLLQRGHPKMCQAVERLESEGKYKVEIRRSTSTGEPFGRIYIPIRGNGFSLYEVPDGELSNEGAVVLSHAHLIAIEGVNATSAVLNLFRYCKKVDVPIKHDTSPTAIKELSQFLNDLTDFVGDARKQIGREGYNDHKTGAQQCPKKKTTQ